MNIDHKLCTFCNRTTRLCVRIQYKYSNDVVATLLNLVFDRLATSWQKVSMIMNFIDITFCHAEYYVLPLTNNTVVPGCVLIRTPVDTGQE